jgi:amidohydrolase
MHDLLRRAYALQEEIKRWRRDIHMHPELGFHEHRTARLVADALRSLALEVETGVAKTGVVGRVGKGRPAVGIRADMDALAVQEANDLPYASQVPGVMHACGHDAHVAILLAVASLLADMDDRPPGEIRLLFQPCEEEWDEEGKSGAPRMVEAGALEGLDAVLALHVDSGTPSGHVGLRGGHVTAAVDPYDAIILGVGCHSASPQSGVNPIFLLAQVVHAIQGIQSLRINPLQPAIISVEAVHAGASTGVIPNEVHLHGNIRCFDSQVQRQLAAELEKALAITQSMGGDYRLTVRHTFPPTYNDPGVIAVLRQVAEEIVGADSVYEPPPEMFGEDFSYMAQQAPAAFFRLGVQIGDRDRPHHNPAFDVDESALPVGAAVLVGTACRLLQQRGARPSARGDGCRRTGSRVWLPI